MVTNNPYIIDRMIAKALRLKWPDAKVTNQNFNREFSVEFPNGEYGYAGTVNGPVGCDLYPCIEAMAATGQPYDSVEVCPVWVRMPLYYDAENWVLEPGDKALYNETVGMYIVDNHDDARGGYYMSVMIGNQDYNVAWAETVDELKEAATNYVWMLEAATDVSTLIDGPDIILYPITNEYQLADSDYGWNEKRPFNELLDILYGKED